LFGGAGAAGALSDTWVWLPPTPNVVSEGATVALDASGNWLVTVTLKNGGNIPLSSIQVSTAKLGSSSSALFTTPASFTNVPPGSSVSFTAKFPPSAAKGTTAPVLFAGTYSAGPTVGAAWTANIRAAALP
jgi:hypothetical protein